MAHLACQLATCKALSGKRKCVCEREKGKGERNCQMIILADERHDEMVGCDMGNCQELCLYTLYWSVQGSTTEFPTNNVMANSEMEMSKWK